MGEIGTFLKTPLNLWASQTCYYPVDILYIEMWKPILGKDMGLKGAKGNNWLGWSKDKAAPAELGFACQTPRRTVVDGSKTNPRIGGGSVLLKLEAHLCQSIVCATDTPSAVFQSLPGSP